MQGYRMIDTVKLQADIDNPTVVTGYLVDGNKHVPIADGNRDYQEVQEWIAEGNIPDPAFTQQELDDYAIEENEVVQDSMIKQGNILQISHDDRTRVGSNGLIVDQVDHDTWMKNLYDDKDGDNSALRKPPPTERQRLAISGENNDNYVITRFQDTWGYRWHLELFRGDVNALAIAIYDINGSYLYTTGGLIDTGNGSWYTECPAGQADASPSDVYYKWLLGSANISDLEVYAGVEDTKRGVVRSDERYD